MSGSTIDVQSSKSSVSSIGPVPPVNNAIGVSAISSSSSSTVEGIVSVDSSITVSDVIAQLISSLDVSVVGSTLDRLSSVYSYSVDELISITRAFLLTHQSVIISTLTQSLSGLTYMDSLSIPDIISLIVEAIYDLDLGYDAPYTYNFLELINNVLSSVSLNVIENKSSVTIL